MSIDQGVNFYSLFISVFIFLLGVLNTVGMYILNSLKKNDEKLFNKADLAAENAKVAATKIENIEKDIDEIKQICRENHRRQ